MAGSQRVYRQRINSTQALKKIFRAMELIAASRIGKARDAAQAQAPYASALTKAVSLVATHASEGFEQPLLAEYPENKQVAMLVLAADRGMAGAYTANVLREAEIHAADLTAQGREVQRFVVGRRGVSYYDFRGLEVVKSWLGASDSPTFDLAKDIASELISRFGRPDSEGGVGEIHVVFTAFLNMVSQEPRIIRMLPLQYIEMADDDPEEFRLVTSEEKAGPHALYTFEPNPDVVLNALLPRYIRSRIYDFLLQAAASELAGRQRAMHTATDNAEDLIRKYTRLANQARQADITQEISEIVSGADALAAST